MGDVIGFITDYELEYGEEHPAFYQGSYTQALSYAKSELKFLLIYLHNKDYRETSKFCRYLRLYSLRFMFYSLCFDIIFVKAGQTNIII